MCSDEEIAALYAHFKKRVDTELGLMDKPQDVAAENVCVSGDGEDNDNDNGDDECLDFIYGCNSFDSEDFSDSDWELDQKKPKVCEKNAN